MREKSRHPLKLESSWGETGAPAGKFALCGLMSGTGATLRSGRVRVFARRTVPVDGGGRWVRIGISAVSYFTRVAMLQFEKERRRRH